MTGVTAPSTAGPYRGGVEPVVTTRSAEGPSGQARDALLAGFVWGNRRLVLPMLAHRTLGPWVGSPVVGYFLTLTTTGRRSGLPRVTPLNYAILDGHVYVLSGFGTRADWYRNLVARPDVVVGLPGRVVRGTATPVHDAAEAERAALCVARNCGFALVFEGVNPLAATDERLRAQFAGRPAVRITTDPPVRAGRHDPGSRTWLLPCVVAPVAAAATVVAARRLYARCR